MSILQILWVVKRLTFSIRDLKTALLSIALLAFDAVDVVLGVVELLPPPPSPNNPREEIPVPVALFPHWPDTEIGEGC